MPTRYALDLEGLKNSVSDETLREESQRIDAKKNIKKVGIFYWGHSYSRASVLRADADIVRSLHCLCNLQVFEQKYQSGQNKWMFTPLKF